MRLCCPKCCEGYSDELDHCPKCGPTWSRPDIGVMVDERDRLAAENAELKGYRARWESSENAIKETIRRQDRAYAERDRVNVALAAANATLDRLLEAVPEGWHWCADCEKMTPPDEEDPDFCGVCESENYWHRGVHVALQAILYPENDSE